MRYINTISYLPSAGWLQRASAATEALFNAADDQQRLRLLGAQSGLWSELKGDLLKLSFGKCWYCESLDIRSDNAVDHFRPKGNVRDARPPHEGYWWLAFDWRNYRYSCTFCNSQRKSEQTVGGKQDFFPLEDETKRARSEADDLEDEFPSLLDPTNVEDVLLIGFSQDGSVGPTPRNVGDSSEIHRAETSVIRYHLTHPYLTEKRKVLLSRITNSVSEADKQYERYCKRKEVSARVAFDNHLREIRDAVDPNAEYSSAVKHLLAGLVSSVTAKIVLRSL